MTVYCLSYKQSLKKVTTDSESLLPELQANSEKVTADYDRKLPQVQHSLNQVTTDRDSLLPELQLKSEQSYNRKWQFTTFATTKAWVKLQPMLTVSYLTYKQSLSKIATDSDSLIP